MYERLVQMNIKKETRDKIKLIKKELSYDEFLRVLIKKEKGENYTSPNSKSKGTNQGDSNEC